MVNAWSLLYEELNGTMDETYPIIKKEDSMTGIRSDVTVLGEEGKSKYWYDYDRNDPDAENPFESINIGYPVSSASPDTITFTGIDSSIGGADTVAVTGSPLWGGMGEDHISLDLGAGNTAYNDNKYYVEGYDPYPSMGGVDTLNLNVKPKPNLKDGSNQKYQEDKGIADLKSYVASTYQGHYTNKNSDVQTLDLIHSVGDAESFCRSNAIKYLSRYDKKGSAKNDILKAMHYCLLLYYFSGNTQEPDYTNTRYETF